MAVCCGCDTSFGFLISKIYNNDDAALDIFRAHNVLPMSVKCQKCNDGTYCHRLKKNGHDYWKCYKSVTVFVPKKKRIFCNFYVSDWKGTFLEQSRLSPWRIMAFAKCFLHEVFKHSFAMEVADISLRTSVDWRSFCGEVMLSWVDRQPKIGGEGVVVEIDETLLCKRKYERGRLLSQIWLFGGIERVSKKCFVVPLIDEFDQPMPRSKLVLLGFLKKFVEPGSVVYSDQWKAYDTVNALGYSHGTVNHSVNFVNPVNHDIHTQNVERLWLDVKSMVKRCGMRSQYIKEYLGRYLFMRHYGKEAFHEFLLQAARLYPPQGVREVALAVPDERSLSISQWSDGEGPLLPNAEDGEELKKNS